MGTIIVGLILVGACVFAIRRIRNKGMCDCSGDCSSKATGACSHCSSAEHMVDDILNEVKENDIDEK